MKNIFQTRFLLVAVLVFQCVQLYAAPASVTSQNAQQQPRRLRTAPANFGPNIRPTYSTTPVDLLGSVSNSANPESDPLQIAKLYTAKQSGGLSLDSIRVASSHVNKRNGVTHVYLQQVLHGLDIVNAVANVNLDASNKVVSVGNSFLNHAKISSVPEPATLTALAASDATSALAKFLGLPQDNFAAASKPTAQKLKYIQTADSVRLGWDIIVHLANYDDVFEGFVDAASGQVLSLQNLVSDLTAYNVYPFGINDPESGDRKLVQNPEHPVASPYGWHSQGILGRNFTDTQGNNVHASNNPTGDYDWTNKYRPDGGQGLVFDFPVDLTQHPREYEDAAITNLFYWSNMVHDFYYAYGFDEESGNFQRNNFDRGGAGNDPVITFAQDGGGLNNANFMTLPDGEEGIMRMYIWSGSPMRDGDLDGGIIVHEYSHGLSIRLTGGPTVVNCLGFSEAGGMGEGWGDILATVIRTNASSTRADDYNMGGYSDYSSGGIRNYLYSTNMTTNPSTYAFLDRPGYWGVHAIGEVWAVMLYDVYWNLVDEYGFESDWFNTRSPAGNTVFIQLVIDGMKLQPCTPTFVMARDAILQADQLNYGGWHRCVLWRGFAKRGLGLSAVGGNGWTWDGEEAFDVPAECEL